MKKSVFPSKAGHSRGEGELPLLSGEDCLSVRSPIYWTKTEGEVKNTPFAEPLKEILIYFQYFIGVLIRREKMSDSDKNISVFAVLQSSLCYALTRRRDKWIFDIPCLPRVIFFFFSLHWGSILNIYSPLVYSNFKCINPFKTQKNNI